jgi:aspartate/methionine/tyrosine aminotransferase
MLALYSVAVADPGDEVILTDATYAGTINRAHLARAVPRLVPFTERNDEWRLDLDAFQVAIRGHTRALLLMKPSMPREPVLNQEEWAVDLR